MQRSLFHPATAASALAAIIVFQLPLSAAPAISGVATTPATPTNLDAPYVTATVTPSPGATLSQVQLTYSTGAVTTGTVFQETMSQIPMASPWTASGGLNSWTATIAGAPPANISQSGGGNNHTTPITLTGCTTTTGSAAVTCASTAGLWRGMLIAGANIPAGATVASITNAVSFVLSTAATGSGSALTLSADGITLTACATANGSATVTCASTAGLVGTMSVSLTACSTVAGSPTVSCASTAGLTPGMSITGTAIPNTTISSVTSSTQFILNQNATATGSALTLTATLSGMPITGPGMPPNVTVSSVTSSTQFVLTATATATAASVTLTAAGCGLQLSKGDGTYTDTMAATTNDIAAAGSAGTVQFYAETQSLVAGNGWTMQLSPDGGTTWNTRVSESYNAETVNLTGCSLTSGSATVTCASTTGLTAGMIVINPSVSLTGCSSTSGSATITCASTTGLLPGMVVTGAGIPNNATVNSITSSTQFVISAAATTTNPSQTITAVSALYLAGSSTTAASTTVTCTSTTGLLPGMILAGPNIPNNATVSSVTSGTQFVISLAATATASAQTLTASYLPATATISSITNSTQFLLNASATITASSLSLAATTGNHGFQLYTYTLQSSELVNTLKMRFQFSGYNPAPPAKSPAVNLDDISVVTTAGVPPVTVAMTAEGSGVYSAQLPAEASGTTVGYSITATDSAPSTATSAAGSYTVVTAVPVLAVSPSTGLSSAGEAGSGSYSPSSATYMLTNNGTGTMTWTASNTTSWLSLSSTGGTLSAGASTTVTASINATNANSLAAGTTYNDAISFTNANTGVGNTTIPVSLLITSGLPSVPAAPTLTLPAFSPGTSATISWAAVSTAASYTIQIATSSSFTSNVVSQTVTSPTATFANLANGVTYYYRVEATNAVGSSTYSNVGSSVQDTAPPTVAITAPTSGISTPTNTLTVTGTSSDSLSGIASVTVNSVAATTTNGYATWTAAIPLGFGTNAITATAIDGAGNLATTPAITATLTTFQTYNPLIIPDVITGTTFNLALNQTSKQFPALPSSNVAPAQLGLNPTTTLATNPTTTLGYNGALMWGPTLIMNKGDTVQLNVTNHLDLSNSTLLRETTSTVHWHGFHIPATMDGGPLQVIPAGTTWSPTFTVLNSAATYWYHPHLYISTQEQLTLGAGGFIIIRDPQEAALALPRTYGVDDFPLALTSRRFLSTGEFGNNQYVQNDGSTSTLDNYGDFVLVNGTINAQATLPKQYVRLRLLNAEIERGYNIGFSDNRTFYVIGNDQGLLNAPVPVTSLFLMVGERVEILVNLGGDTVGANTLNLMAYNKGTPVDFPGSENTSTQPTGGSEPENGGLLNQINFSLLNIKIAPTTANPITALPSTLASNTYWTAANATNTRTFNFDGGAPLTVGGVQTATGFTFNTVAYSASVFNTTINLNAIESWTLNGLNVFGHAFHVHDVKFNIIARSNPSVVPGSVGGLPAPYESGWKDTVFVPWKESVTIVAQFSDFASNTNPYMYHCHFLDHEDGGLMGQFLVVNNQVEDLAIASCTRSGASDYLDFQFNSTAGTTYALQYSPDLTTGSWTDIGSVTSDGTSASFTETDATRLSQSKGFYRVVLPSNATPPVFTSATTFPASNLPSLTATATHGQSFTYQITASNSPVSYSAGGLPAGLSVNTTTGLISGTPTAAGTSNVVLVAANSGGTSNGVLVLTVN